MADILYDYIMNELREDANEDDIADLIARTMNQAVKDRKAELASKREAEEADRKLNETLRECATRIVDAFIAAYHALYPGEDELPTEDYLELIDLLTDTLRLSGPAPTLSQPKTFSFSTKLSDKDVDKLRELLFGNIKF